jgi:biopolymer transport protein TolR
MALGTGGLNQTKSEINVTPLIDVLLVLLVLFMIITPLLTKALGSDIPKTSEEALPPEFSEKQLVLTVTRDGRFHLNREEIGLGQLGSRLHGILVQRGSGERVVFINADDDVPYGTIVQAMDICHGAGAENVGIVTENIEVTK